MKKENGITNITVIISIILSMLVGRVKSSTYGEEGRLLGICGHDHKYMPFSTIFSETDKLRLEDYAKKDTCYTFIKNISTDENDELNSKNTTDIIAIDAKKYSVSSYNCMYTCFYREVEENGEIKKKYIPYEEATGEEKKILIVLKIKHDKFIAQIQEAKNRLANPEEDIKIKTAIELMKRILNQIMYRLYMDNNISNSDTEIKDVKSMLERIGMAKTAAYSLFSRKNICSIQRNLANLLGSFENGVDDIKKILYNYNLSDPITENNEKQMKLIFLENIRTIVIKIINRRQNYREKTAEEIRNDFYNDLIMFINILTDKKIDADFHIYINQKQLKKEIEKIEDEEIKSILYEAVNKCLPDYDGELSIGKLRNKINNRNTNPFYLKGNKKIKTEQSTNDKTEKKANMMLNSIISSGNIKTYLESDEILKETNSWNRDIVSLMCSFISKYTEFERIKEDLIEEIVVCSTQIAREAIDIRQKKYGTYKNMFAIQKIVENEINQIKSVLEKRKDTAKLERDVATYENEQIIKLLEIISSKPDDVTEEEKQIIKALKYISKGGYNSEKEQRITEVLHKIGQKEYTPEEQKEKNKPQDKQDHPQRHIKSILSEIAEEFIKEEDYQVADKTINNKKQEIVDMVVEKLSIVYENSNILDVIGIFKKIVENIVDVLIDNVIDRTQHKRFKAVEEEIAKEAEYIKSQDLEKSLSVTVEYFEKYANLNSKGHLFLYGFSLSFPYTYIAQMINIIIKGPKETVDVFLFNGIYEKLTHFLCIFSMLCELDVSINILKTYNEFWLNPTSFHYSKTEINLNCESCLASINYKNTINGITQKKEIILTSDNLQAFRKAKTVQDIKKISK